MATYSHGCTGNAAEGGVGGRVRAGVLGLALSLPLLALASAALPGDAHGRSAGRDTIRVVGSSTVYPFVTVVAEEYGLETGNPTPVVESTGTGGGIKLFCERATIDAVNASRAMLDSERADCARQGTPQPLEIKLGYDGIVLSNHRDAPQFNLTLAQVFSALARQVPVDGALVDNPYRRWNQIDPALPDLPIEVYGPPPTSGTRDAFVELGMEPACANDPAFVAAYPDADTRKKTCRLMREDGAFIEAGENDNIIAQKLMQNKTALGIFGYSFLDQNSDGLKAASINGTPADYATIRDGTYPLARPMYVYIKPDHTTKVAGLSEFGRMLVSADAIGEDGYLADKGLIALPEDVRAAMEATVRKALR